MIQNKKGLSDIVVTLIIIVLSLVAIGGVWLVVRNVLNTGGGQVDVTSKCLSISVDATKVNCTAVAVNPKICTVALSKTGSEVISGVLLVFKNQTSGTVSSAAVNVVGDVPVAVGKVTTQNALVLGASLSSIEVTPYFTDASGNQQLCSQKTSFSFIAP
jgi:hypothetical protein